ncbi:MAG: transporter substrate-binding domain-containing protein [Planctomycetota bacterium]|nr:transporter substrate-binding domain-containing protein [Planctomycetota bacterium]
MRLLLVLFLALACIGCGESTESTLARVKARGVMRVAMEPTFPPFETRDENDQLVGFDVDLARVIGGELGVEVEFVTVVWDSIIPTLLSGKADFIISGMTATAERALTVSYTEPYFHTITCLLVSSSKAPGLTDVEQLNEAGRVIVVKEGTTGHTAAEASCPKANIVAVKTENDAAREVQLGRADAFLYDLRSIRTHHRLNPDDTYVITKPVTIEPYAIAFAHGDAETAARLNAILRAMRGDGRLKELHGKYDLEDTE